MKKNVVVIGAGITGVATAWALCNKGHAVTLLEKLNHVGGFAASFKHEDYILDYGPHKIYSTLPGIMQKYKDILGDDCLEIKKKNSLRLLGKYLSFPPKLGQMIVRIPKIAMVKCGFSFSWTLAKNTFKKKKVISYEDYFVKGFGRKAYSLIFEHYAWKVWGDPKNISEEIARRRTPVPSIFHLAKNVIFGTKDKPEISADIFYYPKNGIGQVCDKMVEVIKEKGGRIKTKVNVTNIDTKEGKVVAVEYEEESGEKKKEDVDYVVSTIHLMDVTKLFNPEMSKEVVDASSRLKFRALVLVYVFIDREKVNMDDNWIFFPEREFIFNRVSDHASFSKHTCPEGKTVITAEVTCDADDGFYNGNDEEIYGKIMDDLEKGDILKREDADGFLIRKARRVYPIYRIGFREDVNLVIGRLLEIKNFITLGRQGLFNYNNTDHCIDMALHTATHIDEGKGVEEWKDKLEYFDNYRIVD
jgi:protoporphyrinogen oxidase